MKKNNLKKQNIQFLEDEGFVFDFRENGNGIYPSLGDDVLINFELRYQDDNRFITSSKNTPQLIKILGFNKNLLKGLVLTLLVMDEGSSARVKIPKKYNTSLDNKIIKNISKGKDLELDIMFIRLFKLKKPTEK